MTDTAIKPPPLAALSGFSHARRFGDIEVVALADGHITFTFAGFPPVSEAEAASLLAPVGIDPQSIPISVNAFLVRKGGRSWLIDAGTGDARGARLGHLPKALAAAGTTPEDIAAVLITHMHVDHVAGLYDGDAPVFANAELWVGEAEHAFWRAEDALDDRQRTQLEYARKGLDAYRGRTTLFAPGEIIDGVLEPLPLPGHTPGQTGFFVGEGADRLLIWADLIHVPWLECSRPDIAFIFDVDREAAEATRRRVLEMAATEGFMVTGAHLPFPGFARVRRDGTGYRIEPVVTPEAVLAAGPAGRSG
jgi:glyoxylase-like metal-dependent hydrolase (beta-lactamase superfamily II)